MLSHLKVQDLILIEKAEIEFERGLNIFTGETGAGKSAILTAIRLIGGERADSESIRAGAQAAIVEAKLTEVPPELLGEITPPIPGQPLTIRREIHRSGKSRCFIEDQLVNASVLRDLMQTQLERVDQSSSTQLFSPEVQRNLLDNYASLEKEASELAENFSELTLAKHELEVAIAAEQTQTRDFEWAESTLKEIEEVDWKKEEEERLNQSHLLLTHAQDLTEKIENALEGLSSLSSPLRTLSHLLDKTVALDPSLSRCAETVKTARLELEDAEHFLRSYSSHLETDPHRLAAIESRIGAIETVKRRFGPTWEEVEKQKARCAAEIDRLQRLDDRKSEILATVGKLEKKTASIAKRLSEKRQQGARTFSQAVLRELCILNLPYARFELSLSPKPLSSHGIDEIRFLFTANPGLTPLPLDQCASGGELSRLLFATKIVLAERERVQCLVFDEIDSNVGGQTAAVLGEKLQQLSKERQVICVTHFVQVARFAMRHFAVAKKELSGRAATYIEQLKGKEREREYSRMIGHSTEII